MRVVYIVVAGEADAVLAQEALGDWVVVPPAIVLQTGLVVVLAAGEAEQEIDQR